MANCSNCTCVLRIEARVGLDKKQSFSGLRMDFLTDEQHLDKIKKRGYIYPGHLLPIMID